jgi:putative ABC transport system substrate-binding protein
MRRRLFTFVLGATTIAVPFGAPAQDRTYKVGFLMLDPGENVGMLAKPLAKLGYVDGKNIVLDSRSAGGDQEKLPRLAEEMVRTNPDVLVAGWGTLAPKALRAATSSVPIIFTAVGDPVGAGLIRSLARPGGNVTGLSGQSTDLKAKQLQLLLNVAPGQTVVGVLTNPDTPYSALALKELRAAAEHLGVRLTLQEIRKPGDFGPATLDALVAAGAQSLFISEDPLVGALRDSIAAEAIRCRLPTITGLFPYAAAGALLVYGPSIADRFQQAAIYVDKILRGARAADLPVEQPTKFELIVNLKTAKSIGLAVPPSLLAQADEVVE